MDVLGARERAREGAINPVQHGASREEMLVK
jgi:hypothetical protein